ncbi:MAG TPA: periplasmic heavy metal sensor [Holophagaceae bacterium]|nr:periplasmic heavy metal sensor [Holophagaceae bacterium]
MLLLFPPALLQGPPMGPPMGPPPRGPHHPEMPLLRCAHELGLSEDQMSKIHEQLRTHRDVMEQKGLAFHQAQRALHDALRDPGASRSQMDALLQAAAAKEAEFLHELYAINASCWEVLTPTQRSKAKELMSRPPKEGRPGGREGGPRGFDGPGGDQGPGGSHGHGFGGSGMPPPPGGREDDGF